MRVPHYSGDLNKRAPTSREPSSSTESQSISARTLPASDKLGFPLLYFKGEATDVPTFWLLLYRVYLDPKEPTFLRFLIMISLYKSLER